MLSDKFSSKAKEQINQQINQQVNEHEKEQPNREFNGIYFLRKFWNNFNHILSNSFWLLLEKLNRAVLGLLVGAWLARYLGPSEYGELAYALAYISFFQAIVNLGTDGIIVRDLVKHPNSRHEILGTTFRLRLVTGIFFWIISILVIQILKGWSYSSIWFYAVFGSIVFFQAFDTLDLWFQSQNQSKKTAWSKLLAHSVSNLAKVVLIILNARLELFAIAFAMDGLLTSIGLYLNYRHNKTERAWVFNSERAKVILKESWPYIVSGLSIMIYMRIGQFMIEYYQGWRELGIFAVAQPISQLWYVIPMTLMTSLAPYISAQKAKGEKEYLNSLIIVFRSFAALGLTISLGIFALSEHIVDIFYGPVYSLSAQVLGIHIFTNLFVFQTLALNLWIINEAKGLYQTYQTVLGAITALVANYLLIPHYGILGAAWASVLSYAVSGVFSNLIFEPKIFLMQFGIKPKHL